MKRTSSWAVRLLSCVAAAAALVAGAAPAHAHDRTRPVANWVKRHAVPLETVNSAAPLGDLAQLRRWIGDSTVVGLGEANHDTAELATLKHRTLRLLVEEMGFRSIAWEADWTLGLQLNDYIRTGKGDLYDLIGQLGTPGWRSAEVADVLRWLRHYNATHRDDVQFVGLEAYATRPLAYEAVEAYVARTAPERLPEARRHLKVITPFTEDMKKYLDWYRKEVTDKERYVRHARALHDLVKNLSHRPGDRQHFMALQHTRAIESFYVRFSLSWEDNLIHRDAYAANSLRWWRTFTGDKIAYWAASVHTANAPQLRYVAPPQPDMRFPSAGSYLRRWYGTDYLSIAFTFDHGTVNVGDQPVTMPPPAHDWFERPFAPVRADQFTLDLRAKAPRPVREWLEKPTKTRGLPGGGHDSYMTGGSLSQWFDVIVHRQQVTPAEPI